MKLYLLFISMHPDKEGQPVGVYSTREKAIAEAERLWAFAYDGPPLWNSSDFVQINHPAAFGQFVFAAIAEVCLDQTNRRGDNMAKFIRELRERRDG